MNEINDIRVHGVVMRKSDVDVLMSDMKELEADNKMLLNRLKQYEEAMEKIFKLSDRCNFDVKDYEGLDTVAYWIKEEGKPFTCSKCGYSFWNGTDNFISHCCGCGRRMEKIEYIK